MEGVIVDFIVGMYLVGVGLYMDTFNVRQFIVFKFAPVVGGAFYAVKSAQLMGWM